MTSVWMTGRWKGIDLRRLYVFTPAVAGGNGTFRVGLVGHNQVNKIHDIVHNVNYSKCPI